jgi:hypothetical protein
MTIFPPTIECCKWLATPKTAAHEVGHTLGLMHNYISSSQNRASVMDYPPPMVLNSNNEIDLSSAYTNEIGDWDKVSINMATNNFQRKQMKLPPLIKY